jgi:uroporphyrin-3 C-methyltransferase
MKTTIFTLIIAIGVAVLSLFQFDRYQKFTYATQSRLSELDKSVSLKSNDTHQEVEELKSQTHDLLLRIQHSSWKTSEIHYLITLATTRLDTLRDVPAAIRLLTAASDRLQTLNDPSLAALQQALNHDLSALKSVSTPDSAALWTTVGTVIADSTAFIPNHAKSTLKPTDKTTESTETTPPKSAWQEKLWQSLQEMKDLVKIRHYSKPVEPLLTETQQTMVKEILRSLLEQIRFSILENNQIIYEGALKDSLDWLNTYFDTTDSHVLAVQEKLTALQKISLNPSIPSLSVLESLDKLR